MSKIEWTDATWNPVRGCSRVEGEGVADMTTDLDRKMRELGITTVELAAELGVSEARVASWRQGRRRPCCAFMEKAVAAALLKLRRKP